MNNCKAATMHYCIVASIHLCKDASAPSCLIEALPNTPSWKWTDREVGEQILWLKSLL